MSNERDIPQGTITSTRLNLRNTDAKRVYAIAVKSDWIEGTLRVPLKRKADQ